MTGVLEYGVIHWHKARESGNPLRTALISGLLELGSWLPIWLAILTLDPLVIAGCVVGTMLGTYLGMRERTRDDE